MANSTRWLATAIGLAVMVGLGLLALLLGHSTPSAEAPRVPAAPRAPAAEMPTAAEASAESDAEAGEMLKTKTELKAEYAQRREELAADVAKPIDQDIGVIEGAAADLAAALAREPDNQDLKRMLVATYRNEFRLLKKALHLSSAEKDEAGDASAEAPPKNATAQSPTK